MTPIRFKHSEMRLLDDVFDMGGGYVLDFSNRTFAEFFDDELGVNIDDPRWDAEGTSKAKRLRYFLRNNEPPVVLRTLLALWEYREKARKRAGAEETVIDAEDDFYAIIEKLGGSRPAQKQNKKQTAPASISPEDCARLKSELMAMSQLEPQPRGYAFEHFLKNLFDANGLSPRASFKLVGEQIDGSFELSAETYLLEAKWTAAQIGVHDLRSFNSKCEDKAQWSRGLFISESGFTGDGLQAFGSGRRVVCMDGLDLYEMLDRNISFADVMARKVRRAAESGQPFVRLRDLY